MHIRRHKCQLTLHLLGKIQLIVNNYSKSHYPKIASLLFALNLSKNQLTSSPSNNFSKLNHKLDINHINKNTYKLPSKKPINGVRFTDASQGANSPSTSVTSSHAANQTFISAKATRAADQSSTPPNATPTGYPSEVQLRHRQPYLLTSVHLSHQVPKSLHLNASSTKYLANRVLYRCVKRIPRLHSH